MQRTTEPRRLASWAWKKAQVERALDAPPHDLTYWVSWLVYFLFSCLSLTADASSSRLPSIFQLSRDVGKPYLFHVARSCHIFGQFHGVKSIPRSSNTSVSRRRTARLSRRMQNSSRSARIVFPFVPDHKPRALSPIVAAVSFF